MSEENKARKVSSIVDNKYSGYRIDNYLSEKFDYHSRNEWQNLIKNEIILHNSKICKPSKIINSGDTIEFIIENFEEPECNLNYEIIYQDSKILIINKPHNCIIHPVGPFFKNTLVYKLEEDLGFQVFSVNRIDRETTGLVLFGKDTETAAILSEYFVNKKIYKEYVVAVHGIFPESLKTKGYLLHDEKSEVRKKRKFQYEYPFEANDSDFETSETDFELIKTGTVHDAAFRKVSLSILVNPDNDQTPQLIKGQIIPGSRLLPDAREKTILNKKRKILYCGNEISLIKVILKTGRQHQIRATLSSLNYPVIGDKLYGFDDTIYLRFIDRKLTNEDKAGLLLNHQALHAKIIKFIHPYSKKELTVEAKVPEDILNLFY